jgi:hypothetical protein
MWTSHGIADTPRPIVEQPTGDVDFRERQVSTRADSHDTKRKPAEAGLYDAGLPDAPV